MRAPARAELTCLLLMRLAGAMHTLSHVLPFTLGRPRTPLTENNGQFLDLSCFFVRNRNALQLQKEG